MWYVVIEFFQTVFEKQKIGGFGLMSDTKSELERLGVMRVTQCELVSDFQGAIQDRSVYK